MNITEMDIPVGAVGGNSEQQMGTNLNNGWHGLTIKEILEKVDLFNVTTVEEDDLKAEKTGVPFQNYSKNKEGKTVYSASNPESAFLGPKLWDKPISLPPLDETEFSVMNIDEFLTENNLNLEQEEEQQQDNGSPNPYDVLDGLDSDRGSIGASSPASEFSISSPMGRINIQQSPEQSTSASLLDKARKNQLPKGENGFLYAESKRARIEREKAERKRKMEMQIEFAPEDLALATIPGADFDPRRRAFSMDELRPQPIIRKRKKQYVAQEKKDERYWEKRSKNNVAARRSREARRLKENQIALRAAFLEKQNAGLKAQVDEVKEENDRLKQEKEILIEKLMRYESL